MASGEQLDIFGRAHRRPGRWPKGDTWQPGLFTRDHERQADGEALREALKGFGDQDTDTGGDHADSGSEDGGRTDLLPGGPDGERPQGGDDGV